MAFIQVEEKPSNEELKKKESLKDVQTVGTLSFDSCIHFGVFKVTFKLCRL